MSGGAPTGPHTGPHTGLAIVVDDAHLGETQAIADALGRQGLAVERVVPEAGAIYARGPADEIERHIARARDMEGVLEVRPEEAVRLPPMDGDAPQ
jgi:hypothetical protein